MGGTVTFSDSTPVEGLVVDFFVAEDDGSRGRWLGDVRTDSSGFFERPVRPGCYVLTYIAPEGDTFVGGGKYHQISVCVEAGEKITDLDAQLASVPGQETSLGGTVTFSSDSSPVAGLVVDYFAANADGSRALWLGDEITGDDGSYRRVVEPGCYVLVFIAPGGTEFAGSRYDERPVCVASGETAAVDAELTRVSAPCTIQGQVVVSPLTGVECDALLALYDATAGPGWIDSSGWATPTDPCTWIGVGCVDLELRVLALRGNQLVGSLPSELGQLTNLEVIDLVGNELDGSIPAELGQLSNLRFLLLTDNGLSGPIPPELGQLASVSFFELGGNALSGSIPDELLQLSELAYLNLGDNELTGPIPPGLGLVTTLFGLTLGGNELSGPIPPELGQLTNLHLLDLGQNQLSGPIPPELGQLTGLQDVLDLAGNQLSGSIPAELGQLQILGVFLVDSNLLTGDITGAMAGLRDAGALQVLVIADGPGGNDCLTVSDAALADWISALDPDWAECDAA